MARTLFKHMFAFAALTQQKADACDYEVDPTDPEDWAEFARMYENYRKNNSHHRVFFRLTAEELRHKLLTRRDPNYWG